MFLVRCGFSPLITMMLTGIMRFSGQLRSEASPCHGYNENDRRAICIEDLRDDVEREEIIYQQLEEEGYEVKDELKALLSEGERERSKRRRGTCGLGALPVLALRLSAC